MTAAARGEQPGLPVVLFGHSMGSFLSRAYAAKHAGAEGDRDAIAGLVLSGTAGDPRPARCRRHGHRWVAGAPAGGGTPVD